MAIDYQAIILKVLSYLGEKSSEFSAIILDEISSSIGLETGEFSAKLLNILIFSVFIYLASKITHKLAKFSIIIIFILLIISTSFSFFK